MERNLTYSSRVKMIQGKARVEGKRIDEERNRKRHCDASVENHETGGGRVLVRALIRQLLLGSSSSRFLIQRRTPSLDEIPVNSLTRKSTAGSQSSWRAGGERCKNDRWETSICNNATDDKTAIV